MTGGPCGAGSRRIAIAYEVRRLRRSGHSSATEILTAGSDSIVVRCPQPGRVRLAEEASPAANQVLLALEAKGVSRLYPGFDILTVAEGKPDRLIELKSSGVDARVQAMSWNEWKTARAGDMRHLYWLYLVGNLRSDLAHAVPFVRAISDPFGSLVADEVEEHQLRRAVQLRVREFTKAEHLDLGVTAGDQGMRLFRSPCLRNTAGSEHFSGTFSGSFSRSIATQEIG